MSCRPLTFPFSSCSWTKLNLWPCVQLIDPDLWLVGHGYGAACRDTLSPAHKHWKLKQTINNCSSVLFPFLVTAPPRWLAYPMICLFVYPCAVKLSVMVQGTPIHVEVFKLPTRKLRTTHMLQIHYSPTDTWSYLLIPPQLGKAIELISAADGTIWEWIMRTSHLSTSAPYQDYRAVPKNGNLPNLEITYIISNRLFNRTFCWVWPIRHNPFRPFYGKTIYTDEASLINQKGALTPARSSSTSVFPYQHGTCTDLLTETELPAIFLIKSRSLAQ